MDENKDLMKNDSVQSLSYPHLPTPKIPASVTLLMSNLDELISNNLEIHILYLVLDLVRRWVGGWVDINHIKNKLVQRGLADYKSGLLFFLGIITGTRKGYTSEGGQQLQPWDQKIISSISWQKEYHVHNLENRG